MGGIEKKTHKRPIPNVILLLGPDNNGGPGVFDTVTQGPQWPNPALSISDIFQLEMLRSIIVLQDRDENCRISPSLNQAADAHLLSTSDGILCLLFHL